MSIRFCVTDVKDFMKKPDKEKEPKFSEKKWHFMGVNFYATKFFSLEKFFQ